MPDIILQLLIGKFYLVLITKCKIGTESGYYWPCAGKKHRMRYLCSRLRKVVRVVVSHFINNSSPRTVASGCSLESVLFDSQLDFDCRSELCLSVVLMNVRKEELITTKKDVVL
jgi:hypothetical protein